jgi:hypothetical protein
MATVVIVGDAPVQEIQNLINANPLDGNIGHLQYGITRWLQWKFPHDNYFGGGWNGQQRHDQALGTVIGIYGIRP